MIARELHGRTYAISEYAIEHYSYIVDLIFESRSIADDERQYWLGALDTMSETDRHDLLSILETDKQKYETYSSAVQNRAEEIIQDVHQKESSAAIEQAKSQRIAAESESRTEDHELAEDLLNDLESI